MKSRCQVLLFLFPVLSRGPRALCPHFLVVFSQRGRELLVVKGGRGEGDGRMGPGPLVFFQTGSRTSCAVTHTLNVSLSYAE